MAEQAQASTVEPRRFRQRRYRRRRLYGLLALPLLPAIPAAWLGGGPVPGLLVLIACYLAMLVAFLRDALDRLGFIGSLLAEAAARAGVGGDEDP